MIWDFSNPICLLGGLKNETQKNIRFSTAMFVCGILPMQSVVMSVEVGGEGMKVIGKWEGGVNVSGKCVCVCGGGEAHFLFFSLRETLAVCGRGWSAAMESWECTHKYRHKTHINTDINTDIKHKTDINTGQQRERTSLEDISACIIHSFLIFCILIYYQYRFSFTYFKNQNRN